MSAFIQFTGVSLIDLFHFHFNAIFFVVIFHLGAHLLTLPLSLMSDYTTIWPIHFVYVIINTVFAQVIRPKISDAAHFISNVK